MDALALMTLQEAEMRSPALAPALACIGPFIECLDDPRILASPRKQAVYLGSDAMPSRYAVNGAKYWDALVMEDEARVSGYAESKDANGSTSGTVAWSYSWDLFAFRMFLDEVVEEVKKRGTAQRP